MFRFLRRYNKWILAVGGTLLLIVFLVPDAISALSQVAAVSGAAQATVGDGGEEITAPQFNLVQREVQALEILPQLPGIGSLGRVDPWHWYLLVREAEAAGLVGGRDVGFSPELSQVIAQRTGLSWSEQRDLVARINGVSRLLSLYVSAPYASDRRLRDRAERLFYSVQVQPLVIKASADAVTDEPSDEEIRQQMEAFADVAPEDAKSPFGYRLANRVKLEWLRIPMGTVRTMIEASDRMSGTELRKHWRSKAGQTPIPPLPDTTAATVPDVVRHDLLKQLAAEEVDKLGRFAINQLRSKTLGEKRSEGYLDLGPDWTAKRMPLPALAQLMAERFGIALPEYHSRAERWLDPDDLKNLDGIGRAKTAEFPPGDKTLVDLVAMAREFGGSSVVLVQAGVAADARLTDEDGNLYVFRILEADPARPPKSVDEVRDRVVSDLKRKRHFQELREEMSQIEQQAERDGLIMVAIERGARVERTVSVSLYDRLALAIQSARGEALRPVPSDIPEIGSNESAATAIIEYAISLPQNVAVDTLDEAQRVFAVAVEDRLAIVVGRVMRLQPFTEESYQRDVDRLQAILSSEELEGSDALTKAFSLEVLKKRHNLVTIADTSAEATPSVVQAVER